MNLPTVLISLLLIFLYILAVRYVSKHGSCDGCSAKSSCSSTETDCAGSCPVYRICKTKPVNFEQHQKSML